MAFLTIERAGLRRSRLPGRLRATRSCPSASRASARALGADWSPTGPLLARPGRSATRTRTWRAGRARRVARRGTLRERLAAGAPPDAAERALYEDLVVYLLFDRYQADLYAADRDAGDRHRAASTATTASRGDLEHYLPTGPTRSRSGAHEPRTSSPASFRSGAPSTTSSAHILGGSLPAARLRAAVWQSIFTHDVRRYRRGALRPHGRRHDADHRPVGDGQGAGRARDRLSRATSRSTRPAALRRGLRRRASTPLNLSALSPDPDRVGAVRPPARRLHRRAGGPRRAGSRPARRAARVFLDEIGEVDAAIQVKLLRVLQTRTFQRLGETRDRTLPRASSSPRPTATWPARSRTGRFRADLYYRLCSDLILTPSLARAARRRAGRAARPCPARPARRGSPGDEEADALAGEAERVDRARTSGRTIPGRATCASSSSASATSWSAASTGRRPRSRRRTPGTSSGRALLRAGALTADELLRRYCTLVYARTGSYEETARRLGLDRRTVRERIDPALLAELRGSAPSPSQGEGRGEGR